MKTMVVLSADAGHTAPWGAGHRKFFNEHFDHYALVYVQGEDLPMPTNWVTLDKEVKDSGGLPAARVRYKLHENDRRLVEWGRKRAREVAEAAGDCIDAASTGVCAVNGPELGWHIMGTRRMGNRPQNSITNKFNQTWNVPDLFIADASALTTGAAVNLASTLQAVAVRCAEYI